jgi:hypothetical protein
VDLGEATTGEFQFNMDLFFGEREGWFSRNLEVDVHEFGSRCEMTLSQTFGCGEVGLADTSLWQLDLLQQ